MAWTLVTKADAASFCGVDESIIQDSWSTFVEKLIIAEYKHSLPIATYTERYDGEDKPIIFLKHTPVLSVTSIKYINYTTAPANSFISTSTFYNTTNFVELTTGDIFPEGIKNIEITYSAGMDYDDIDARLQLAELTCIAHFVKFYMGNRGDDSIKFSEAPSLGSNQYSARPGLTTKIREIIRDLVPKKIRIN